MQGLFESNINCQVEQIVMSLLYKANVCFIIMIVQYNRYIL